MTDSIATLDKLTLAKTEPNSNKRIRKIADVVADLLMEYGIYDLHAIGQNLSRLGL